MADEKVFTVGELVAWIEANGIPPDVELWVEAESPDDSINGSQPAGGLTLEVNTAGFRQLTVNWQH